MATGNEPQPSSAQQPHSATGIPRPKEVPATEDDYGTREGHLWKRVHIKPRTKLYIPQQTQDGPDVTKLMPEWSDQHQEQDGTGLTTTGQRNDKQP